MGKNDIQIVFPDNRPFYLSEIKLGYASEHWKPAGVATKFLICSHIGGISMLIVFSGKPDGKLEGDFPPDEHFQFKGFVNLNCAERAFVGITYDDDQPFLLIGDARVFFQTQDEAIKTFNDIVAAYARGDKVFYINLE